MKSIKTQFNFKTQFLPLAVVAILGYGCSGSDQEGAVGTERMEETTSAAEKEELRKREKTAIDQRRSLSPAATTRDNGMTDREATQAELKELRDQMQAELDKIRERLKDGTRTPELQKADQNFAASITQQIERTDRTLDMVTNSSEEEWPNAQERAKKELIELRSWVSQAVKPSR